MSQSYNNGPADSSAAVALVLRQNTDALLTNHAGVSLPGYAAEGTTFYRTTDGHLFVAKPYASKAFGEYSMGGPNGLTLAFALTGAGQDGSLLDALVRVRTDAVMSSLDHDWSLVGPQVTIDFNHDYTPGYFAGRIWSDAVIGEPVLYTNDGDLRTKLWETIPTGFTENVYSGSPSPLMNDGVFVASLRAVDYDDRGDDIGFTFNAPSIVPDHVILPTGLNWWEVQDNKVSFVLYDRGVRRPFPTFKAVPFFSGGVVKVALYNRDPIANGLAPFNVDTGNFYELLIGKKV